MLGSAPVAEKASASAIAPLERVQSLVWLAVERAGEALREGGMLVVVFGLLDYFLGEGKQTEEWPWRISALGVILWAVGVGLEWGLAEVKRRWTEH